MQVYPRGLIFPLLRQAVLTSRIGSIDLFYWNSLDVPGDLIDQVAFAVLSAPALEIVTVNYTQNTSYHRGMCDYPQEEYYEESSPEPPLPPPAFPHPPYPTCTDLRELHIYVDNLSLRNLWALLHLPRNLEVLHLRLDVGRFSPDNVLLWDGGRQYTRIWHLSDALKPAAHSLRELAFISSYDNGSCSIGYVQWADGGLREFERLEFLGMQRDMWGMPWSTTLPLRSLELPASLKTLHPLGARLVRCEPRHPQILPAYKWVPPGSLIVTGISGVLDSTLEAPMLTGAVDSTLEAPMLTHIQVLPGEPLDLDDIRRRLPPVSLPVWWGPLVDRGIKILLRLPDGTSLELETRYMTQSINTG